jgi:hypothetical protein
MVKEEIERYARRDWGKFLGKRTFPPAVHASYAEKLEKLLAEALEFSVSNLGTDSEFYSCRSSKYGEFPDWVIEAKEILKIKKPLTLSLSRPQ